LIKFSPVQSPESSPESSLESSPESSPSFPVGHDLSIGPLHDPVTWYGINYPGTQVTSPDRLFFVLKVPLRNLRPSVIYSVPCDRIVQRAYSLQSFITRASVRKLESKNTSGFALIAKQGPRRSLRRARKLGMTASCSLFVNIINSV